MYGTIGTSGAPPPTWLFSIDGGPVTPFQPQMEIINQYRQLFFQSSSLDVGQHTLRIVNRDPTWGLYLDYLSAEKPPQSTPSSAGSLMTVGTQSAATTTGFCASLECFTPSATSTSISTLFSRNSPAFLSQPPRSSMAPQPFGVTQTTTNSYGATILSPPSSQSSRTGSRGIPNSISVAGMVVAGVAVLLFLLMGGYTIWGKWKRGNEHHRVRSPFIIGE